MLVEVSCVYHVITKNNKEFVVLVEVVGIINLQLSSIRPSLLYTQIFVKGIGK